MAEQRASLNLSSNFEFHFATISDQRRVAFFEVASHHNFNFAVCSLAKENFDRQSLTKLMICEETVRGLACTLEEWYLIAEACRDGRKGLKKRVIFDESSDANYIRALKESFWALRSGDGPNKKLVGAVKPGKSKVDTCLQLADMVCGAVGRYLEGEDRFYKWFRTKQIGLRVLDGKNSGMVSQRLSIPLMKS